MANTIAIDPTHHITPKHSTVGLAKVSVVTTETYATASAGFTVDFTAALAALNIAFRDVVAIIGNGTTLTGHSITTIKTATAGTFTIRLWNGSTEIADGALTQTLQLLVFYSPGAAS